MSYDSERMAVVCQTAYTVFADAGMVIWPVMPAVAES